MNIFKKVYQFIRYDVWRRTEADLTKTEKVGYMTVKTILLSIRGFSEDELNTRANALTYSLAFALVPILALVLAIAKGFGFEQVIENKLNSLVFLQGSNVVPELMGFVERYLETAQGGLFLGIGILVLLWSVYSFFRNIELSFNHIWDVQKSRSYLRQFCTYITILVMLPVMVIVSSGLSVFVNSALDQLTFFASFATLKESLIKMIPFVLCWAIFSWMYWAIPNTKVGFGASVVPGILMGTLYQLLQMLSVYLIALLSRTSLVYGAFAAIPLLLIWLQWSCLLILIGAEMSYAIQNNEYFEYEKDMSTMSRRYKDFITLYLVYLVVHRFEQGGQPYSASELAVENHLPIRLVNNLLGRLTETKLLCEVFADDADNKQNVKRFVPAVDIHRLTVGSVLHHIEAQGTEDFLRHLPKEMELFAQKYRQLQDLPTQADELLVKDMLN